MLIVEFVVSALIGYLLGSIPMGLVIVRLTRGIDIRQVGSGRTGGTNALRAGGWRAAVPTVFLDGAKGFLAVIIAQHLFGVPQAIVAGLASVAGHNWSVYIGFKGGAGTGPNVGSLLALSPITAVLAVLGGFAAAWLTRIASLATFSVSVTAAVVLVVLVLVGFHPPVYLVYAFGQLALVALALIPNFRRLAAGTEKPVTY